MRLCLPVLVLAAALSLGACASGPRPVLERGWVGGDLLAVRDGNHWLGPWSPDVAYEPVVAMPADAAATTGLLVREAHRDTPLGRAGIVPGDLLLAADGAAVGDALEFRESMDERAVGSVLPLRVWRSGAVRDVDVVVGRERYQREGRLAIGLGFPFWTAVLDIWPFDDGIDVLGIVTMKVLPARRDAVNVRGEYIGTVKPDAERILPPQEQTVFRVFPITVGKSTLVLEQTAD